jgi:hypothetical protein
MFELHIDVSLANRYSVARLLLRWEVTMLVRYLKVTKPMTLDSPTILDPLTSRPESAQSIRNIAPKPKPTYTGSILSLDTCT